MSALIRRGYESWLCEYGLHFFMFRVLNVFLASTWFVPDESFQSVEVAFKMVYGKGFLTWEWHPDIALRSAVHPTICSTRTLSNTIETALTIMALNWYQSSQLCQMDYGKKSEEENILCKPQVKWCDYCFYILHAAFAVIVRPTAVLIWVPLYLVSFYESLHKFSYLRYSLLRCSILCGLAALLISFIVDLFYYGSPTLCLWNFAKFNLLQGGSAHFGANVWFWYFINGLPSVFTIQCLPLFILLVKKLWIAPVSSATGLTVAAKLCRKELPTRYFWTSVFYVTVHSLIAHKEHRFLLPVIPLLMPYLVVEMNDFLNASANFNVPNRFLIFIKRIINSSIILLNCGLALYFGLVHQRGPHAAANFVFSHILEPNPNTTVQILQLMPCFSMPQHYSLHPHSADIKMLDCTASLESMRSQSEELVNGQVEEYREDSYDEADQFHNDPLGWIRDNWPLIEPSAEAISVVIAYEKTFRRIESFLEKKNYKVVKSIFHGHFLTSSNQDSTILISVKTDNL